MRPMFHGGEVKKAGRANSDDTHSKSRRERKPAPSVPACGTGVKAYFAPVPKLRGNPPGSAEILQAGDRRRAALEEDGVVLVVGVVGAGAAVEERRRAEGGAALRVAGDADGEGG